MRFSRYTLFCLIIAVVVLSSSTFRTESVVQARSSQSQEPLNNDAIIKMVKAGLGEDVIVSMVELQPARYSLTPDALIALKTAGVSDKIIGAMIKKGQTSTSREQEVTSPVPEFEGFYLVQANKLLELKPTPLILRVGVDTKVVDQISDLRTSSRRPTFIAHGVFVSAPQIFRLVHKPAAKKDGWLDIPAHWAPVESITLRVGKLTGHEDMQRLVLERDLPPGIYGVPGKGRQTQGMFQGALYTFTVINDVEQPATQPERTETGERRPGVAGGNSPVPPKPGPVASKYPDARAFWVEHFHAGSANCEGTIYIFGDRVKYESGPDSFEYKFTELKEAKRTRLPPGFQIKPTTGRTFNFISRDAAAIVALFPKIDQK